MDDFYECNGVDVNKLKRDYIERPLQRLTKLSGKPIETPYEEDLEYLYIELNIPRHILCEYFGISEWLFKKFVKKLSIHKPKGKIRENIVKGNIQKYGVENYTQTTEYKTNMMDMNEKKYGCLWHCESEDFKEKSRKTKLEKYGNSTFVNPLKTRQTCLEKYGETTYSKTKEYIEKTKQTNMKRYESPYGIMSESVKEKSRKTKLERYNDEFYHNPKKSKETSIKRYNKPHYTNRLKALKTTKDKYGVENYTQTKEFKELYENEEFVDKIIHKRIETMRKNGTLGQTTSKEEQYCFELLKEKYPDAVQQYSDERYPYRCDMYVPSKDLFIEYQGFWTHGKEPYIGSWEQKKTVKVFESKNTPQYQKVINEWAVRDPLKRKTAKDNDLNWLEFFSVKEFEEWLKNKY